MGGLCTAGNFPLVAPITHRVLSWVCLVLTSRGCILHLNPKVLFHGTCAYTRAQATVHYAYTYLKGPT